MSDILSSNLSSVVWEMVVAVVSYLGEGVVAVKVVVVLVLGSNVVNSTIVAFVTCSTSFSFSFTALMAS